MSHRDGKKSETRRQKWRDENKVNMIDKEKKKKTARGEVGRPIRMTEERMKIIIAAITGGNYNSTACKIAGISEGTFYGWMDKARIEREEYEKELIEIDEKGLTRKEKLPIKTDLIKFLEDIEKSEAAREAKWVSDISHDPSWQSKAWLLERKYHERWGRHERHVIAGDKENPIALTFEDRIRGLRKDRGIIDEPGEEIEDTLNTAGTKEIPDDTDKKEGKSFLDSVKE